MRRPEALADVARLPPMPVAYSRYKVLCATVVPLHLRVLPAAVPFVAVGAVYGFVVFGWVAVLAAVSVALAFVLVFVLSGSAVFGSFEDRREAAQFAALHGGVLAMPAWVHGHPDFRTARVCRGLSPAQREVFEVLCPEWDGTLGEALGAARSLAPD